MPQAISLALASCFLAAGVAGAAGIAGAVAPQVAPDVMTMETMDGLLGQGRYQDRGTCEFWVVNMSFPAERIERTFDCSFYWDWSRYDGGHAHVHEALLDLEEDAVFEVPNMERGNMEEWYHVDGHMLTDDALAFQVEAARDPGVLMPPPGADGSETMGWVTSGGERGGEEKLLHPRDLEAVEETTLEGVDVRHWNSSFLRERVQWHGYDVYLSEHVDMWSDPKTGWVLEMHRHVVVEMTPHQMAEAAGQPAPPDAGGEPEPVMALQYDSTPEAVGDHADETRFFQRLMLPIEHGPLLARLGAAGFLGFAALGLAGRTVRGLLAPPGSPGGRAGG